MDVAFTRRSEGRPSTEGTDISFGCDDVRGFAFQSRPGRDARLLAVDVRSIIGRLRRRGTRVSERQGRARHEKRERFDHSHFGLQTGATRRADNAGCWKKFPLQLRSARPQITCNGCVMAIDTPDHPSVGARKRPYGIGEIFGDTGTSNEAGS